MSPTNMYSTKNSAGVSSFHLWPTSTGWGKIRQQRIPELLSLFGLAERADDLIQSYSRGMRQKVAVAAALVHEPGVLILDEPLVGLDPRSARILKDLLRKLAGRGVTVFMSTHILEIAQHICSRVGIISGGRMIACGTLEELRALDGREPASLEDVFLQLTGGEEYTEVIRFLGEEAEP